MESKIEKIEIVIGKEMCIEEEIQNLYENYMELVGKINQIIDHLNSQAQPEENEEWEEELGKLMSTWGKVLYVNKGRIGKGMQTDMYTRFYKFVKQLLDEREREAKIEVLTEIFQTCYQEDSRTLELVQEKLQDLKDLSLVLS